MQLRKQRRIFRHKVPNLCEPGLKFDSLKGEGPTFFSKISNTFKLLQQPVLQNGKNPHNLTHAGFRLLKKATMSIRMRELVKPKERSMSLPQKFDPSKEEKKERYSSSQIKKKPNKIEIKEDQIVGTGLALLPLQKILAERDQHLRIKEKHLTMESQDDEDHLHEEKKDSPEDLRPVKDDFVKWLQKIVGNQGNLYEQYERKLLDKANVYERKRTKHKANHEGSWK